MRIPLNLLTILFSVILIYVSTSLFFNLSRLQASLQQFNNPTNLGRSSAESILDGVKFNKIDIEFLEWDSEINQVLATINTSFAALKENRGQQQIYLSKAQNYYKQSRNFTPRNVPSIIGNLSLLIDQGAPLEYLLPRVDELILLTPKDQDLKADVAMLCFKLSVLNQDEQSQSKLINSLNQLFTHSMDYRGMTQVRRYAKVFDQNELLTRVDTNVKN